MSHCKSISKKAKSNGGYYSCSDPPRLGNVQSIKDRHHHSPDDVLRDDICHFPLCCRQQCPGKSGGYVDTS